MIGDRGPHPLYFNLSTPKAICLARTEMCNVLCRLSCLGALFSHCGRGGPQPVGDCFDLRLWSRGDVFTWPGRRKLKMIVGSTRERTRVGAEVKKKKMWKKKEKRSSRKFFFGPSRDWPTSSNRWGHHFFLHFPSATELATTTALHEGKSEQFAGKKYRIGRSLRWRKRPIRQVAARRPFAECLPFSAQFLRHCAFKVKLHSQLISCFHPFFEDIVTETRK